jgi:uncharacterized membrane protein YbhN (UPF0104 family)
MQGSAGRCDWRPGGAGGGSAIHIVDVAENVMGSAVNVPEDTVAAGTAPPPKPGLKRLRKLGPPVLGVVVLVAMVAVLHRMLSRIGPRDVLTALAATPLHAIVNALGLLAVSLCIMAIYDVPGIVFAKKLISFPAIGARHVALASFSAYALSHVLGAPALSGAAIRLRLYAQWGVPAAGIARIIALSATNFVLGAGLLASLILLLHPGALPMFGHEMSVAALTAAGLALVASIVIYVVLAGRTGTPITCFGRPVPLPGSLVALFQLALSFADISVAGAILFSLLPTAPGLSLPQVLAIYLAAFAGGLFSGLPGGIGVFDSLLLLELSDYLPPATAIGAILLFRVIYYLIPASAAALCFAAHEIFLTAKG